MAKKKNSAAKPDNNVFQPEILKMISSTSDQFANAPLLIQQLQNELKTLSPKELEQFLKGMDTLLTETSQFLDSSLGMERESVTQYRRTKKKQLELAHIPFKEKLFCLERILDLFIHHGFTKNQIIDQSFVTANSAGQLIFVEMLEEKPVIRMTIPIDFRKKTSIAKKREFICDIMQEFPFIRLHLDQDSEVMASVDYQYLSGIWVDQLITCAEILISDAETIYFNHKEILDIEDSGLVPNYDDWEADDEEYHDEEEED